MKKVKITAQKCMTGTLLLGHCPDSSSETMCMFTSEVSFTKFNGAYCIETVFLITAQAYYHNQFRLA